MENEPTAKCNACGTSLAIDSSGPCPKCGKVGTKVIYTILEGTLSFTGALDKAKIRKSLSFNVYAIGLLILISLISPLTGIILPGCRGITASYGLSIIGFVVGCFAINKVREIERYIER